MGAGRERNSGAGGVCDLWRGGLFGPAPLLFWGEVDLCRDFAWV